MLHGKARFKALAFGAILLAWALVTPDQALAAGSGRQLFNVVDYGAKRDGSASATDAFRKAIQAAKAAGGGTIYVPTAKYNSGPIELFRHLALDITAGATIQFPVSPL